MARHFFIAGAQRSGTTYLYRLLAQHPEIEMAEPVRPEPKFFITEGLYAQGRAFYEHGWFGHKPGARLLGEKSTSYMESPLAAARIAAWYPDAAIVFLLRDPIERAVSNYWFSINNGLENLKIEDAFRCERERWQEYDRTRLSASPFAYLRRGRYIDYLDMFCQHFSAGQVHVLLYEQLLGNLAAVQDLYRALGVDGGWVPRGLDQVVNESQKGEDELTPEFRASLARYYEDPNTMLSARFGLDLSCWRSCHV